MIKIENLHKSFGDLKVLKGISIEIEQGECVSIIGGSGSGKSVFLRTMAMLEIPEEGKIWIENKDITSPGCNLNKMREKMGMVYQGFHLFSHLNVIDNITLAPRKILGLSKEEAERKGMELLEMVGLASKAKAMPRHLSGGQSQRIAIARCLAMDPKIILFDEPTSALDPSMVGEVQAIIRSLLGIGITMLIVTHEMNFAQDIASRIFYMDEGIIYEEGTPEEIFQNPKKNKTINFIRKLKLFEYEINSKDFDLIAMVSQVDRFCSKYGFSKGYIFTTQLLLEEIITVLLDKYYSEINPSIKFTIEYSEADNKLKLYIFYQGENINIAEECMDEIQKMILIGKTQTLEHFYAEGVNEIRLTIK
jgi:polar amino acid transport system ATP-binding protein